MCDQNKKLTPVWIVYVDGKRLDTKHEGALQKIIVKNRLNGIDSCSLYFDNSSIKVRDEGFIAFGSEISVHLGYKDSVQEIFYGEVTGFKIELQEYENERSIVRMHSILHNLDHGKHCRTYTNKDMAEIAKQILDIYGIESDIDQFGIQKTEISQQDESDYVFVLRNAAMYGMFMYTKGKKVYIKRDILENNEDLIFEWGKSLIAIETRQDISKLINETEVIGWDFRKGESFVAKVTVNDLPIRIGGGKSWNDNGRNVCYTETLCDHGIVDSEEAKQRAIGKQMIRSFLFGKGIAKVEGDNRVLPGNRVTVKYVGENFSGEYLVDSAIHSFDYQNGYITEFNIMRNMMPGDNSSDSKKSKEEENSSNEKIKSEIIKSSTYEYEEDDSDLKVGKDTSTEVSYTERMQAHLSRTQSAKHQFHDLVQKAKDKKLMGKAYVDEVYMCTHFVQDLLENDASKYMPSLQVLQSKNAVKPIITDPDEGVYIFYKINNDNVTGHTGFVWIDKSKNQHVLHNGRAESSIQCVNLYNRTFSIQKDLNNWFQPNNQNNKVVYKSLPTYKVIDFKDVPEMDRYTEEWDNE